MPNFHATNMQMNNTTETPIRMAKAYAMRFDFSGFWLLPRNIKNKALARLARMARNAMATKKVIVRIMQ